VGGQIEPYFLSKVMGTSTCDMMVIPESEIKNKCVRGICGQVKGSIIPEMIGLEAGQSAFGDVYAWFKKILVVPTINLLFKSSVIDLHTAEKLRNEIEDGILYELSELAQNLFITENSTLAIDWLNGRRTPDAEQRLEGAITHLNLGTDAVQIFHALVEATCFGAKAIVERFREEGVPVKGIIGLGGVAKKSAFIMQMMSDVLNMPIKIHKSEQSCALGAAMFAATAAGIYPNIEKAMSAMGPGFETEYFPNEEKSLIYQKRYLQYQKLGSFLENKL
ncbi:MAG: ribulokinase, partial [Bacteroidetes bacterium]|nr:ribulokinase [Bacteroidota bacterium]